MASRLLAGGLLAAAFSVGCVGDLSGRSDEESAESSELLCASTPFVRRLTVIEYVDTVRAALGVDIEDEATLALPADLRSDGFSNTAGSLIVTLDHVEGYDELAELAVSRIPSISAFAAEVSSCGDLSKACAEEVITGLSTRLYRGEARADEVAMLTPIFEVADAEGESFEGAVGLVLTAMLQSPRFLYRVENELGQGQEAVRTLSGHDLANRLSYLLWGAPPDEELHRAAADDALRTDAEIEAHVIRMLEDPRARETSRRYLADWLHLGRLDNISRDPTEFPEFNDDIAVDMKAETLAYWETLVWDEERPLSELFNAQHTAVSDDLASFYGLSSPVDGQYDLSDIPERGGLLTQGSILTNGGSTASMVGRGLYIMETFLCGEIGSPPPGVDATPPEVEPGNTQRTYSEERVDNSACSGCHSRMEPMAWGIERYDATGAYAEQDADGNDLLQDGYLLFAVDGDPVPYETTAELGDLLAESEVVRACMVSKASQFAMGHQVEDEPEIACSLEFIEEHFLASSGTYQELMVAIALSPMFRNIEVQQ